MLSGESKSSDIQISVSESINEATKYLMQTMPKLRMIGLGVNDPKRIFGTTRTLLEEFGKDRVMDFPTSENAMLGYTIGLAINGIPSISVHQRFDFLLLAMDQLVNNAAKWYYMFGSRQSVPIVIRVVVGKGWGQGPTHSQSFHAWLSHVPGLKVVMPHDVQSAYELLIKSVYDPNPIIYIEHRWIHDQLGSLRRPIEILDPDFRLTPTSNVEIVGKPAVTVVTFSYITTRVKSLYKNLQRVGVGIEHVILETIKPYDLNSIKKSIDRTGALLVLDFAPSTNSFAKEVVAQLVLSSGTSLTKAPRILSHPDIIEPTSFFLTKNLYFNDRMIFEEIVTLAGFDISDSNFRDEQVLIERRLEELPHDVPNSYFKGPF